MSGQQKWWWLSFVNEKGFGGVAIVPGNDLREAITNAWIKGCNPGGEVKAVDIDLSDPEQQKMFDQWPKEKLISREELNSQGIFSEADRSKHN